MDRRTFLKSVAGLTATGLLPLHGYAQQHKGKVKITDVKCMIVRGTWDWNLIKIETDSGVYGIGEAYWGWGVKDLVIHEGPMFQGGYFTIQDKPGYGIEINPDVAKAHLAPGETWWG